MMLLVTRGTIKYKGKDITQGESFECDADIAENLILGNVAEKAEVEAKVEKITVAPVKKTTRKKATK